MSGTVGLWSHLGAAIGFGLFTVWLLIRRSESRVGLWLALAAMLTAAWAFIAAVGARYIDVAALWVPFIETIRNAVWMIVLVALIDQGRKGARLAGTPRRATGILAVLFVAQILVDLAAPMAPGGGFVALGQVLAITLRLASSIGLLLLVHNLYVAATPGSRWGVRLLCVGLGAAFAYDLNLYTIAFLTRELSVDLWAMRGFAMLTVLPLLALAAKRNRDWRIQLSHSAAFQTFSLAGIGSYLIVMAIAAYGIRLVGGDWGRLIQIAFLFVVLVATAVVVLSGKARAWARVVIAKHFFAYRYDYREEWLRFMRTVGRVGDGYGSLPERVIQAVADIFDSPGGVLFTRGDGGELHPAARWNWPDADMRPLRIDHPMPLWLAAEGRIVVLDELRADPAAGPEVPDWLMADRRAWAIVPLIHIDQFAGLLVLERSRAGRDLNWEDFDLLRTIGRQAASYIAEAQGAAALADARKFDEFNRRFAFIMHDIKNLVSQLSLVSRNAERHADNPEFRADMVATLQSSVGKMNDLLARLSQHSGHKEERRRAVSLADIAREVGRAKGRQHRIDVDVHGLAIVWGDAGRLEQVVAHLVQNAIEASAPGQPVRIIVDEAEDEARVVIEDKGSGMSAAFIRDGLFKPFVSTKPSGFGVGAYEARAIVQALDGRLDVTSREGEGTRFTIRLLLMPGGASAMEVPHG